MKIRSANATHFQSYPSLSFTYEEQGLALISGPTGAGKSTLLDLVPWVLYGVTSKEGAADDVKAWGSMEPTSGYCSVALPDGSILDVTRTRGKSGQNDLFFYTHLPHQPGSSEPTRGKDLTDTQRILEATLGVSADLFLTGSYLTQFSKADTFFIAKAKDRRDVLEKIADQEFPVSLALRLSEARKASKVKAIKAREGYCTALGQIEAFQAALSADLVSAEKWRIDRTGLIESTQNKLTSFTEDTVAQGYLLKCALEEEKNRLIPVDGRQEEEARLQVAVDLMQSTGKDLAATIRADQRQLRELTQHKGNCPTCARPFEDGKLNYTYILRVTKDIDDNEQAQKKIYAKIEAARLKLKTYAEITFKNSKTQDKITSMMLSIENHARASNPYADRLRVLLEEENPFLPRVAQNSLLLNKAKASVTALSLQIQELEDAIANYSWLHDKTFELRAVLLQNATHLLQKQTNGYLEKHFDAALRVQFSLEDADRLEVTILNDGNECGFKALSGGERCMLKLCFSLALMQAAQDKAGVSFNLLMLDEPLNGLDEGLKAKAFSLLETLSTQYSSVFVIEHSPEVKQQFNKVFEITKNGGYSSVTPLN